MRGLAAKFLTREAGEGDRLQGGGGGGGRQGAGDAAAPSTTLRVVPLPRSALLHGGGIRP